MSRIWFLRLATVAVGVALVVVAEGLVRLVPGLGPSPLVVTLAEDEATGESLRATSRFYAQRFFAQYKGRLAAAGQMGEHFFVEPAPANRYRVVFVGASTVQGFPHPRRLAAASFLQAMLADAWPEREVEVVNLGITSIASFAVAQVVEDALVLSPDLVVVYTGHNEFYGLYGAGRYQRLQYFLRQLHLTHLVDGLIGGIGTRDEPMELIKMAAARGEVPLHSSGRATAEQNLRDNLRRVSRLCERAQVPLVLCTVVANDAGFAPVGSTEGDEVWKERVEQAAQVLTRGYVAPEDAEDALQRLEQAAALSSEHAWLWYLQGRALERLGRDAQAQRAFRKARDLDTMPWRAPTAHNAVIRAVAAEHGAVLADVEAAFAEAAPAQGVGWEWMVDHVHFSVAGQVLLARTVLHSIAGLQDIDLGLLRSAEAYRRTLGDLPVERVVAYNKMGAMLAQAPLHQYNGHNVRYLKQLAAMEGQRLSLGERRGVEQWIEQGFDLRLRRAQSSRSAEGRQGPLVLAVADQLFTERDFARAQVYYAAARREVPFTRRGLWAAVQWGWCIKMQGMVFTDGQRDEVCAALKQARFLAHDPAVGAAFVDFVKGQLYHLLGERDPALLHLERTFLAEDFRRRYALSLFQALAFELVWAGRVEDAREYARLVGG
ncbi:MAG: hypothetical protein F4Z85_20465, partial [Gemmatimonadetes bacterium]|nr:hypothetical protein [Gemmatimonadota bacterium]